MDIDERMQKAVDATKKDWSKIRTGIASPALIEGVTVDYYGTPTPISHVANVTVPEPRVLQITPWERSMIGAIEKAIMISDIGITPSNDGTNIRLPMPVLTQDRRKELAKQVRRITEEGRVAIRNIRRDENEKIKKAAKDEDWPEDDVKKEMDLIQKQTDQYIAELDELSQQKENDILKV